MPDAPITESGELPAAQPKLRTESAFPRSIAELTAFMDATPPSEFPTIPKFRLFQAQQFAVEQNDAALLSAVAAEGNTMLTYGDANSVAGATMKAEALFDAPMLAYVRERRDTTPRLDHRARYSAVVARAAMRDDEGERAVEDLRAALSFYHSQEQSDPQQARFALLALIPLAVTNARRYRVFERIRPVLLELLLTADVAIRRMVIDVLAADKTLPAEAARAVSESTRHTLEQMRGWFDLRDLEALAEVGAKFDARHKLGDRSAWRRALADVFVIIATREPAHIAQKMDAARRAALIFKQLGDEAGRREMLSLQKQLFGSDADWDRQVFSEPIDPDGSIAERLRKGLDVAFERGGPLAVLSYIGRSGEFVAPARFGHESVASLEARGDITFSLTASTEKYSVDMRLTGSGNTVQDRRERLAWDQYSVAWTFVTYHMGVAALQYVANGDMDTDDFEALLEQSWIGIPEPTERPNDLVPLLIAPLRAYCALFTDDGGDGIVLVVDSLVLRLEAVFRKLCRRLLIPDWVQRKDGDRVFDETVSLSVMLRDERMIAHLGDDLHAFATFTLLGLDESLRDKVAHALTHGNDYTAKVVNALVVLLLRLALLNKSAPASAV